MRFLFLLFVCATLAQAEQLMIRVQLEYIETDQLTLQEALDTVAPYPLVLRKLQQGKARRYNTEILTTNNGDTATSEAFSEVIYLSEYEALDMPNYLPNLSEALQFPIPLRPANYSFWEARNMGFTLEIQPIFSEGFIDLRLAPEDVGLQKMETILPFKDLWGAADMKFPFFSTKRTNTGITLAPNQPLLLSCYSPPNNSGKPDSSRPILLFVTASVLTAS